MSPCVLAVTHELDLAGIPYKVVRAKKHYKIRYGADFKHCCVASVSPSDFRAPLKARAHIRRAIASLGV